MASNNVVLVTGAGRGIGRAAALHLARGDTAVVVNDLDGALAESVVAEIAASGGTAIAAPGSIAGWDEAARIVDIAERTFGRLDGLVNNAGLHYQASPDEEREARVRATVEVNLLGSIHCGLHAAPLLARQGGAIVNVSSGAHLGTDRRGVYGATKGAVASLTYGWARDMAKDGIRVNAIAPLAATRMTDPSLEPGDPGGAEAGVPRDLAGPDRIAPVIAFLLSDDAADITGQILRFDGKTLTLIERPRVSDMAIDLTEPDNASLRRAASALLAASDKQPR